jgi:hypothetical protein
MSTSIVNTERQDNGRPKLTEPTEQTQKPGWESPKMEDVSEQVMAQPYIRFT